MTHFDGDVDLSDGVGDDVVGVGFGLTATHAQFGLTRSTHEAEVRFVFQGQLHLGRVRKTIHLRTTITSLFKHIIRYARQKNGE